MTNVKDLIENFVATNNLQTPTITNAVTAEGVTENTQASIDALTSIGRYLSTASYPTNTLDTTFHDQFDTMLCHSYAIVSAFRQAIRRLLCPTFDEKPFLFLLRYLAFLVGPGVMPTHRTTRVNINEFSFHRLLTAFVTGVNPRSFTGLNTRQSASTETAVSRLVYRTAFEIEGWKRLIPVRDLFNDSDLEVCSFITLMFRVLIYTICDNKILCFITKLFLPD